ADVRTVPKSRRHPHFAGDALSRSLPDAGVAYRHFPGLGGLRKPRPDSRNTAWRHASFRGYADHMETDVFQRALDELIVWSVDREGGDPERVALHRGDPERVALHRGDPERVALHRGDPERVALHRGDPERVALHRGDPERVALH